LTTFGKLSQYGTGFQTKVIGALLTQKNFLLNVADSLDPEYFENQSSQWIIKKTLEYFNKYHTTPSMEVLSIEVKKIENEILKISITDALRESYRIASEAKDLDYVEQEFLGFCRNQQVKNAIMTSVDLLNMGDFDGIRSLINSALKAGEDKNIGHEYDKDVESRYREDDRGAIPFPWKVFNDLTQGGPGKGDLVLVFGNPGGGKSWVVAGMGAYAASLGYNVVHYTLELAEGYVGKRYDAIFSGIPVDQLDKNREKVEEAVDKIKGKIIIKYYPPKRASFETFESHLQQLELQHDFIPDLIIIDYLDYVKSKPRKDRKEEIDDVYVTAKSFAGERGVPVISPSQANRGAAKNDIIEGDNAAGSYEKIMIADIIFSLARKRKDKVNGTGRWHVMKNRYGTDGLTFSSKIDTSNGKVEINDTPLDDDGEETFGSKPKSGGPSDFDDDDKGLLKQRFFAFKGNGGV
jgi:replicative DNA helicase